MGLFLFKGSNYPDCYVFYFPPAGFWFYVPRISFYMSCNRGRFHIEPVRTLPGVHAHEMSSVSRILSHSAVTEHFHHFDFFLWFLLLLFLSVVSLNDKWQVSFEWQLKKIRKEKGSNVALQTWPQNHRNVITSPTFKTLLITTRDRN